VFTARYGLYLYVHNYSQVVNVCTARFNTNKYNFLPTQCFYVFFVDLCHTMAFVQDLHLCTVFLTETECVYCAVRTGSLYVIQVNVSFCL
jgi:hypothetical protein